MSASRRGLGGPLASMSAHHFATRHVDARQRSVASHAISIIPWYPNWKVPHALICVMYHVGTLAHGLVVLLECKLLPPPQLQVPVQLLAPKHFFVGAGVGEYVCPLVVGGLVLATAAILYQTRARSLN